MNPDHNINLPPQPAPEATPLGAMRPEAGNPLMAEAASAPAAPPPAAAVSWLPPSVPVNPAKPAGPIPTGVSAGQPVVGTPAVADDGDLIEKEWVLKAKQIVQQTKQDPYKQTKELHKFRAEYMKKRYNKMIEPVDE